MPQASGWRRSRPCEVSLPGAGEALPSHEVSPARLRAAATSDGTATVRSDYTGKSGTLTFAASETEKTVATPVLDYANEES